MSEFGSTTDDWRAEVERLREENGLLRSENIEELAKRIDVNLGVENARLRRIEEAARDFLGYCDNCGGTGLVGGSACRWCGPLRSALGEK